MAFGRDGLGYNGWISIDHFQPQKVPRATVECFASTPKANMWPAQYDGKEINDSELTTRLTSATDTRDKTYASRVGALIVNRNCMMGRSHIRCAALLKRLLCFLLARQCAAQQRAV